MGRMKATLLDEFAFELNEIYSSKRDTELGEYIEYERANAVVKLADRLDIIDEKIVSIHHRICIDSAIALNEEFEAAKEELAKCRALLKVVG